MTSANANKLDFSPSIPLSIFLVFLVHHNRHTISELGPVSVQTTTPACWEPGEKPWLRFPWPVACAFLLSRHTIARLLQTNVFDKVPSESSSSGLLNVEKHDDVVSLDVEVYVPLEVSVSEIEFGRNFRGTVLVQVLVHINVVPWRVLAEHSTQLIPCLKLTRVTACRADVLIADHHEENHQYRNHNEFFGFILHCLRENDSHDIWLKLNLQAHQRLNF